MLKKFQAQASTQSSLAYPPKENIPSQNIETPSHDLSIRHAQQDFQKEESQEPPDQEIIQGRNKACIERGNTFTPNSKTRKSVPLGSRSVTPGELKREEATQDPGTIVFPLTSDTMNQQKCVDTLKHPSAKKGEAEGALSEAFIQLGN